MDGNLTMQEGVAPITSYEVFANATGITSTFVVDVSYKNELQKVGLPVHGEACPSLALAHLSMRTTGLDSGLLATSSSGAHGTFPRQIHGFQLMYNVTPLVPNTEYTFTIAASNDPILPGTAPYETGLSPQSSSVLVKTNMSAPAPVMLNTSGISSTNTTVNAVWQQPKSFGLSIIAYEVEFCTASGLTCDGPPETMTVLTNQFVKDGLDPATVRTAVSPCHTASFP